MEGASRRGRGGQAPAETGTKSFSQLQNDFGTILTVLEEADLAPTVQAQTALQTTAKDAAATGLAWTTLQTDAKKINNAL